MSDLHNQLNAIDTIYNTAMKNLTLDLTDLLVRILRNPEIAHKVRDSEQKNMLSCVVNDIGNFQTLVKNTLVEIQQRGN